MKMNRLGNTSPEVQVGSVHVVMRDFLKMLVAALVCGLAVSVVAAGIALVLASEASASVTSKMSITHRNDAKPEVDSSAEVSSYPGLLLLGFGCDAEAIEAVERDWKISIDGNNIDVRVMQTFIVPDADVTAATFNASLPKGARLQRLNVHTSGKLWQGKFFDAAKYNKLSAVDFREISRQGMLIVQNDDNAISTDAIINIAAAETVTVEYSYRVAATTTAGLNNLIIALANENELTGQVPASRDVGGAVWVEWVGKQPAQLFDLPGDAIVERADNRITGLSWEASQLKRNTHFQFAWMP